MTANFANMAYSLNFILRVYQKGFFCITITPLMCESPNPLNRRAIEIGELLKSYDSLAGFKKGLVDQLPQARKCFKLVLM